MNAKVSSENFLQAMDALLNLPQEMPKTREDEMSVKLSNDASHMTKIPAISTKPSALTTSVIVRSAAALMNVFSVLSSSGKMENDPPFFNEPKEFTLEKAGLEFRVGYFLI